MDLAAGAGTGNGQGDEQLLRSASHRGDVAEVRCCGAETDISHRRGSEIEVDPFRQEVGGQHRPFTGL